MEWEEERGVKFGEGDRREKRRAVWQPLLGRGARPAQHTQPSTQQDSVAPSKRASAGW